MPPGVINFLPGSAGMITDGLLASPDLAGIHFTGSTEVFQSMWKTVGAEHRAVPAATRASSARPAARTSSSRTRRPTSRQLAVAIVRGGFEYQGQKCSAASRIYVPQSLWKDVRDRAVAMMKDIKMGDVARLPELHERRHRPARRSTRSAATSASAKKGAKIIAGRQVRRQEGLLHRADAGAGDRARRTSCSARRSSDRWSPSTSIPTTSGRTR